MLPVTESSTHIQRQVLHRFFAAIGGMKGAVRYPQDFVEFG